jgi:hypothetical protein
MAGPANVIAGWIGKKDIRAFISALGSTLKSAARGGQRGEISIIIHYDQDVCVLRIVLVAGQRTDDSDSANTMAGGSVFDET